MKKIDLLKVIGYTNTRALLQGGGGTIFLLLNGNMQNQSRSLKERPLLPTVSCHQ